MAGKASKSAGMASKIIPPVIVFILGIAAWVGLHFVLNEDKAITVPLPWDVIKVGVLDGTNLSMVLTEPLALGQVGARRPGRERSSSVWRSRSR